MIDALGRPQSVMLLGGTSEIGLAVLRAMVGQRLRRAVLAGRNRTALEAAAGQLRAAGIAVTVDLFDAADADTGRAVVERAFDAGDVDVVLLAVGVLGDQQAIEADPRLARPVLVATYLGPALLALESARRLRGQGHGVLVVLSSVAAVRPRPSNFVYGSAKAGLDALARGLADALEGTGARVLVVRPGFVTTRMTAGLPPAPFATTPERVAAAVLEGLATGARTVWVPPVLTWVMAGVRALPRPVFRRLPG